MIRLKDKLIYTKINETVRLFCNSDGYPTPNVEWRKEGTRSVLKNFVKDNQTYSVVDINSQRNFGNYICKAYNLVGETEDKVEVTGVPSPPIVLNSENEHVIFEQPFELKYKIISKVPLKKVQITLTSYDVSIANFCQYLALYLKLIFCCYIS